jgi:hypothetical protein
MALEVVALLMETRDVGKVITNSACFLALDLCSNKWD